MSLPLLIAKQIGAMLILVLIGWLLVKLRLLGTESGKPLSVLLVYAITPCAIISSYQIEFSVEKLSGLAYAAAIALVAQSLFLFVGMLERKLLHLSSIEEASVEYSNAGNLILPLVAATLGQEWVLYATAYLVIQAPFLWTHSIRLISESQVKSKRNIAGYLNLFAVAIGVATFLFSLRLPSLLDSVVSSVGDMIGPASMFLIGILLAGTDPRPFLRRKTAYVTIFTRLILCPLLLLLLMKLTSATALHPQGRQILLVVLLAAAAPVASSVSQFAQLFDNEPAYAGALNTLTILLCILSMPLMVYLYLTFQ